MSTLEIIATVLTGVMAVGCYYLKGIHKDLNDVKLELRGLSVDFGHTKKDAQNNAREIYKIRERIHTLEGTLPQIVKYIEGQD